MISQSALEEAKLDAMQRVWQLRRGGSSSSAFFEEATETEDLLTLPRQAIQRSVPVRPAYVQPKAPPTFACSDADSDGELWETLEPVKPKFTPAVKQPQSVQLDASTIGDLPAVYTVCPLEEHQFPVVGVYVDKRVVPGFKYRVRPLHPVGGKPSQKCLFDNRALTLKSIGRGYARRFTFEADANRLNDNENYFWSDNRPEGYAFELEVVSEGDQFTIFDVNRVAQGTLEVLNVMGAQVEIGTIGAVRSAIEKRASVRFTGKVEFFETGVAQPMPLSGTAVCTKMKGKSSAEITKIANVVIRKQRYYLVPGIQKEHRRVTVRGSDINDVPTKYTMTGLEPYELPVVGTYVDPRIIPGFFYKVRPNDRKDHLFNNRALRLVSIGMGYAKRLTFEPDSAVKSENYFWSDSHPDGLGLEPRAILKDMKFEVHLGEQILGEATVWRADLPQIEEKTEKVRTKSGQFAIEKRIQVDVMCHFKLARTGGASTEDEEHMLRVFGTAVVRKEPRAQEARTIRVENVGIDSQLKVLFAQTHSELVLLRKN